MIDDDDQSDNPQGELLPAEQPTVDAGTRKGVRQQKFNAKRLALQGEEFWRKVLADPVGRREVWGLLTAGHAFDTQFACGPNGFPQVEATWFKAGEQAFALRFYHTLCKIDHANVFLMHDEHDARFARRKDD